MFGAGVLSEGVQRERLAHVSCLQGVVGYPCRYAVRVLWAAALYGRLRNLASCRWFSPSGFTVKSSWKDADQGGMSIVSYQRKKKNQRRKVRLPCQFLIESTVRSWRRRT